MIDPNFFFDLKYKIRMIFSYVPYNKSFAFFESYYLNDETNKPITKVFPLQIKISDYKSNLSV